jgi:predicted lysophospholipase L1 biosynthesis ABC-type transport system permease subunit
METKVPDIYIHQYISRNIECNQNFFTLLTLTTLLAHFVTVYYAVSFFLRTRGRLVLYISTPYICQRKCRMRAHNANNIE